MSTARSRPKQSHSGNAELVKQPVKKILTFFESETGSIVAAIVQALVVPLLATGFIYLFRNPLNMSFGECIPTALFIAPLHLAFKLIPKTLTEENNWEGHKIKGTVMKTALGAFFVGIGLIGTSMLASRFLIGSFAYAPYITSGLSIVVMIAAAIVSDDVINLTDDPKEVGHCSEEAKKRNTFIITLISILFLVSLASLFIGLTAAAIVMVIMLAFSTAFALYKSSDDEKKGDVEKGEKPKTGSEQPVTEGNQSAKVAPSAEGENPETETAVEYDIKVSDVST